MKTSYTILAAFFALASIALAQNPATSKHEGFRLTSTTDLSGVAIAMQPDDVVTLTHHRKQLGQVTKDGRVVITATVAELDAFLAELETKCYSDAGVFTAKAVAILFRTIATEREAPANLTALPRGMWRASDL